MPGLCIGSCCRDSYAALGVSPFLEARDPRSTVRISSGGSAAPERPDVACATTHASAISWSMASSTVLRYVQPRHQPEHGEGPCPVDTVVRLSPYRTSPGADGVSVRAA